MTIKKHFSISLIIPILLVVVFVIINIDNYYRDKQITENQILINKIIIETSNICSLTDEYILYQYPRIAEQWLILHHNILSLFEQTSTDFIPLLDDFIDLGHSFTELQSGILKKDAANKKSDLAMRLNTNIQLKERKILREIKAIYLLEGIKKIKLQKNNLIMFSIYGGIVIIFSIINAFIIRKKIIPPLESLLYFVKSFDPDNFKFHKMRDSRYKSGQNELSDLGMEFEQMTKRLSESYRKLTEEILNRKKLELELANYRKNLEELVEKRTLSLEESNVKLAKSQQATLYLLEDMKEARAELLNLNSSLERSNKDLEAFSHTVSHDLRSPLRAVLGFSSKLQKHIAKSADPESIRLIDVISENTIKMQNLITDLLVYSKVGSSNLSKSEIDMNQLMKTLHSDYEKVLKEKEIKLKILSLPKAFGNYSMIKQVMINLLDNAIKFSNKGNKALISIGYSEENEGAYYVKDNGCGFDSKFSKDVFQIFKRVTSNSKIEGTGVGLAIVKRIVESHGGLVWANSKPGKGSSFFFTLKIPKK